MAIFNSYVKLPEGKLKVPETIHRSRRYVEICRGSSAEFAGID